MSVRLQTSGRYVVELESLHVKVSWTVPDGDLVVGEAECGDRGVLPLSALQSAGGEDERALR